MHINIISIYKYKDVSAKLKWGKQNFGAAVCISMYIYIYVYLIEIYVFGIYIHIYIYISD